MVANDARQEAPSITRMNITAPPNDTGSVVVAVPTMLIAQKDRTPMYIKNKVRNIMGSVLECLEFGFDGGELVARCVQFGLALVEFALQVVDGLALA